MPEKSLAQVVAERPFPDYADWWEMGPTFIGFMSESIVSEWRLLPQNDGDLTAVQQHAAEYLRLVYGETAVPSLVEAFAQQSPTQTVQSGEFDALSYAFYRSAFEHLQQNPTTTTQTIAHEGRAFTVRVGKLFFQRVRDHLQLQLPGNLDDAPQFNQLQACIQQIGGFLRSEGYLRDHFGFSFTVEAIRNGDRVAQTEAEFLGNLHGNGRAFAVYEMGYPVILPSAVYLYHTMGEAQHHSSRTIEELFASIGYTARETDDFDPIEYPSDKVVEFWEISKRYDGGMRGNGR
ncbi:MAG: hypothetical protein GY803_04700 [Chloroflexi bacterium]|nr:hypothetical protein [Chloroflexota bacterium]